LLFQVDDAAPVTLGGVDVMPISGAALGDARAVGAWDEYLTSRPPAITQRRPIIRAVAEEVRHDPAAPLPPGRVAPYVASTKIAGAPALDDGAVLARSATVAYTWGAGGVTRIDPSDYVGTAIALPALGALDAPDVEVECSGVAVAFESAPRAGLEIRYTLDGTEPHEGSRIYDVGSRVDLSRELRLQHGAVQIVARFFAPARFEGDPARFGEKFVHHFSVIDRR
jgi:hypothetical protein